MFESEAAAHRLIGYLEEAMRQIDRICDRPMPTKRDQALAIVDIQRIASASLERAKNLP